MSYQSLYRRYRPQKFSEIKGQAHVVSALQNAVARGEVGHAFLFHGPRGTGKTTSARVLAKALNCQQLGEDGEPCGVCDSCIAIEYGRSFDLHELDAASNNGVEDMRNLLGKVNLGTPGKKKVYLLDEVHMLTKGAENALLKSLEEPPAHVVWVLATTEPHSVAATIRSRCQVFELRLLGAEELTKHVEWIIEDASLEVDERAVEYAISVGGGSVRDTLSALDRVVAAGGVADVDDSTDQLLEALATNDTALALTAVGEALSRGRSPRSIGEMLLSGLREAFLTRMGVQPGRITDAAKARADSVAERLSAAQLTRALEAIGKGLVAMRQAPDPRVQLEVALVSLTKASDETSVASLLERIEGLEGQLAKLSAGVPSQGSARGVAQGLVGKPVAAMEAAVPQPTQAPQVVQLSGSPIGKEELKRLKPQLPREVVMLAEQHLYIKADLVKSRANSFFGTEKKERSPKEVQSFWRSLVDAFHPEVEAGDFEPTPSIKATHSADAPASGPATASTHSTDEGNSSEPDVAPAPGHSSDGAPAPGHSSDVSPAPDYSSDVASDPVVTPEADVAPKPDAGHEPEVAPAPVHSPDADSGDSSGSDVDEDESASVSNDNDSVPQSQPKKPMSTDSQIKAVTTAFPGSTVQEAPKSK